MNLFSRLVAGPGPVVWASLGLALGLLLAVFSSAVRLEGRWHAAGFLAVLAVLLAFGSGIVLVPRLLLKVRLDLVNQLRFFRFTARGAVFLALVLLVGFAAVNTGNNLLILVLSALVAAIVVSGMIANLVLYGIHISLSLPESIHARQQAVFFLTLHNLKRIFPSFALRLRSRSKSQDSADDGTDFFVQEKTFPYVRPRERLQVNLHCRFQRRGIYPIDGFEVTTTFPFGFFSRGRRVEAEGSIVVFPELVDIENLLREHPVLLGKRESPRKGWGSGLYNIRNYQGGDSTRFIHWKSTAKVGRLMIKDFALDEDLPLNLVFSTWLPARNKHSLLQFEKAVSCIASLVHLWKRSGLPFSFDSGEFAVDVGTSGEDYDALMEYLACVAPAAGMRRGFRRLGPQTVAFTAGSAVTLEGVERIDYLSI